MLASLRTFGEAAGPDYLNLARAGELAGNPALYEELPEGGPFRWSPLAAWLLVPLGSLGEAAWQALHIAALAAFLDRRVLVLGLLALPFWVDLAAGNVIIFVVLAAWWALRGHPFAFLLLSLLMPRPLMVPVLAWVVWRMPAWRLGFAALFAVHAGLVWWTGLGDEWMGTLLASGGEMSHRLNIAPSRWIGWMWVPIGLLISAWLTYRGRLGLASLAASPYLFTYYLLFGLLELRPVQPEQALPSAGTGYPHTLR